MNTTTHEGLLAEEQKYLLANIDALRTRYPDRYLVIKGSKVHGNFANHDEAVDFGIARFGKGPSIRRRGDEYFRRHDPGTGSANPQEPE